MSVFNPFVSFPDSSSHCNATRRTGSSASAQKRVTSVCGHTVEYGKIIRVREMQLFLFSVIVSLMRTKGIKTSSKISQLRYLASTLFHSPRLSFKQAYYCCSICRNSANPQAAMFDLHIRVCMMEFSERKDLKGMDQHPFLLTPNLCTGTGQETKKKKRKKDR